MVEARRLARHRAEEDRGGRETVEAFEQRRHAGQRDDQLRHVARSWNAAMASANSTKRRLGLAVGGVQASGVACEKTFEELRHGARVRTRRPRPTRRTRGARPPSRTPCPRSTARRRSSTGLPSDRAAATDSSVSASASSIRPHDWRPSTYDGEAVAPIASVPARHLAGELDVAIEVAAVHLAQRLDERGVPGLARLVARVDFELGRSVRVRASRLRSPGEARVAGRRVQAREDGGRRRRPRVEQLLGPRQRLEELHRETHERGMRRDVGRDLELASRRAPPESGTQVAQLRLDPVDRVAPSGSVPMLPSSGGLAGEVRSVPVTGPLRARPSPTSDPRRTGGWSRTGCSGCECRVVGDDE